MNDTSGYLREIEQALSEVISPQREPRGLYEPISYGLSMGGKRVRPFLMMMVYALFRPDGEHERILPAVRAIEVFHNFTLLHDDLMDNAPVRRGKPTVYMKWTPNTAILSGDAMLIEAYRQLMGLPDKYFKVVYGEFTRMALEVCEGQQLDMEFEQRDDVSEEEYIEMVRLKTACLIASSMKIGALLGGASEADIDRIYRAGISLGIAFQLVDDYLDVYGEADFGKNLGGDILEEKKTWLLIRAQQIAVEQGNTDFKEALREQNPETKISKVTDIYNRYEVGLKLNQEVDRLTSKANSLLESLSVKREVVQPLILFVRAMTHRTK